MRAAHRSDSRGWVRRLTMLLRDLEARTKWHSFKVDFVDWAEFGTLYERPRRNAGARAAHQRGDGRARARRAP